MASTSENLGESCTNRQNTFNSYTKDANTAKDFWIVVGSVTGILVAAGIVLAYLLILYGPKIHRLATTLLGTEQYLIWRRPKRLDMPRKDLESRGCSTATAHRLSELPRWRGDKTWSLESNAVSDGPEEGDIEMGTRDEGGFERWWNRERTMRGK